MRSVTAALSGNTKLMSAVMGRFVRNGSGKKSDYGFLNGGEIDGSTIHFPRMMMELWHRAIL